MGSHPAKESLTRTEILDILRRNVALYKNEPEFVNYIVDLALYLLENLAENDPRREALAGEMGASGAPSAPASAPAPPPAARIEIHPTTDADYEPPAVLKRSAAQKVDLPEPEPPSGLEPPAPAEAGAADEQKMPRVMIDKGGRTRIYRVFRAQTSIQEGQFCPMCGHENPPKSRTCKSCGAVL